METVTIDVPTMYADHHVSEVRRLLLALPGVEDVYASSAFHVVRARIDPATASEAGLRATLSAAGYLGELQIVTEDWKSGTPKETEDNPFRHTSASEQMKGVAFGQTVDYTGKPLWPCPGMGPVKAMEEA
ncbi:MAG TPA: heavy-metal-associated domain-containing protein [Anaerolineae bacterium]|nr:heavy-metal-associated domain-containing protein [Anaerolineae bacterium]